MDLAPWLALMVQRRASDLVLSADAPPSLKVDGVTSHVNESRLAAQDVAALADAALTRDQRRRFARELELDVALAVPPLGRFRMNVYRQRGSVAIALRHVRHEIPTLADLGLPARLADLVELPRGLVLVVGAAGSGKSTTLAAMIEHRNATRTGHIVTVEEPIEYVHRHRLSVVDQREVGLDTLSYARALKSAMREAPDVVVIGEIRDRRTMKAAIAYAETGHLCLGTLHAGNATQALERAVGFFPGSTRRTLLHDLASHLQAIVSQRLLTGADGRRLPAVELLLRTPQVQDLVRKGELELLADAMRQGAASGMTTFDDALFALHRAGRIDRATALANADSHTDLAVRIRLASAVEEDAGAGLAIEEGDEDTAARAAAQDPDAGWIDGRSRAPRDPA